MSGSALREILASFGVEVDKEDNLGKGHKKVEGFGHELLEFGKTVAGAFAIEKVVEFGRELINEADELREASIALGLSAQHLEQLQFAASTAGLGVEELRAALARLNRVAAGSAEGKGQAAAFKKLGIDLKGAGGEAKTSGDLFEEAGIAIGEIKNPTERAGVASEIFGKSYAKLLPLFAEGKEGLDKLKAEFEELNVGFDESFLADADQINDDVKRLGAGFKGLAIQALAPLIPYIKELADDAVVLVKQLVAWTRHTHIIQSALLVFGGTALFKTATGLISVAKKVGFLKQGLVGLLRSALPLIVGFLALEDVLTFLSGGKSVTGDLLDRFFGKGTSEKVREFIQLLGTDLLAASKDILAIFTDGQPLSVKFQELYDYITRTLTPQFKADFGAMGEAITDVMFIVGALAELLTKVVGAVKWLGEHTVNAIGSVVFGIEDDKLNAQAKDEAANRQVAALRAATQHQKYLEQGPAPGTEHLFADALGAGQASVPVAGFGMPEQNISQSNDIKISVTVPPGTDAENARSVGKAAADGTREGVNLYATMAAIPQAG